MGRSYNVPRDTGGESRFLLIFTPKSFLVSTLSGVFGYLLWFVINLIIPNEYWIYFIGATAVLGYLISTIKIPDAPFMKGLRRASGEKVLDIVIRTITFKKRKKIYVYREK